VSDSHDWTTWIAAARQPHLDRALRALYESLDADIAGRGPTCWLSGKCCHFDSYGHRLYATGLEIAWLLAQLDDAAWNRLAAADLPQLDGCPFQMNRQCSAHAIRPLGCRVFFCDPTAKDWQNPVYESHLQSLRELHEQHDLPYAYMEWRHGLDEVTAVVNSPESR